MPLRRIEEAAMTVSQQRLSLLPQKALIRTSPIDHADWNFQPLLGMIQRLRFRLILSLWPSEPIPRLLEIGYGSGIFMPTLATRCDELYGVDIHPFHQAVQTRLQEFEIAAQLFSASAESLPFADGFFDCLVAVSCLEFIPDLQAACREMKRVLRPGGSLILVTPGHSLVTDVGLRLLTGESAKKDFSSRREGVLPTLQQHFSIRQQRSYPWLGGRLMRLYSGYNLYPSL
jgi:ubiquinone/menaquinone biosynthesis C-methylase UbiE